MNASGFRTFMSFEVRQKTQRGKGLGSVHKQSGPHVPKRNSLYASLASACLCSTGDQESGQSEREEWEGVAART